MKIRNRGLMIESSVYVEACVGRLRLSSQCLQAEEFERMKQPYSQEGESNPPLPLPGGGIRRILASNPVDCPPEKTLCPLCPLCLCGSSISLNYFHLFLLSVSTFCLLFSTSFQNCHRHRLMRSNYCATVRNHWRRWKTIAQQLEITGGAEKLLRNS
jgi:hypothetical protein